MNKYLKFKDYTSERYNVSGLIAYMQFDIDKWSYSDKDEDILENRRKYHHDIKNVCKILNIPDEYKGKPVIAVKNCSFIPDVKSIHLGKNVIELFDNCFYACDELKNIYLNEGLRYVGDNVFKGGSNNKKLNFLPESLEYIGKHAFIGYDPLWVNQSCSDRLIEEMPAWIKVTHLPKNLKFIGEDAFMSPNWFKTMTHLDIPENFEVWSSNSIPSLNNNIKTVKINKNLRRIGHGSFRFWENLEEIFIPKNVKEIGYGAFAYCNKLKRVIFEEGSEIKKIENSAFYECESLEEINFPNSVEELGMEVFKYCNNLKHIEIPDSVNSIGDATFNKCKNLEYVKLPNNIECISEDLFLDCESLKEIKIPDSVKCICDGAFAGCSSLKELRFPDDVEEYYITSLPEQFKLPTYFTVKDN